jgi:hypothetical protein
MEFPTYGAAIPWLTSQMGAAHGRGIEAAQQERDRAMYVALSDWEDEGGSTLVPAQPLSGRIRQWEC